VKPSILIVDDRPENLVALEQTLSELDAELVQASSGEHALTATLNREFALAILDVQMPVMDGYELAEYLRGDPSTREIPIIFLTAAAPARDQMAKGYQSGAVDYMVKPFEPLTLVSKVRVFLDLYDQKTRLRRQGELLKAMNAELEAFAYSVSHDLRAPLRSLEGFSQALVEDYRDRLDDTGKDYLDRISSAARKMDRLIIDLLELARISRVDLKRQWINLSDMGREILAALSDDEPEREVEVNVEDGLEVVGDPVLLRQVMENLLGNAWKYTGRRQQARIELGATVRNGQRTYHVRDNGAGFDAAHAGRLFTPFSRLHDASEFPGTGIGLSIIQRIVLRHGGWVWAEAEVDRGATFFFTIGDGQTREQGAA